MSNMVRTQIYLPRDLYERLRRRGEVENTSMASQIREALTAYWINQRPAEVLQPDDPLWSGVGAGDGPSDAAEGHDRHLYGQDDGQP